MNCDYTFTNEAPYLKVNGFPVNLDGWSVGTDPTHAIADQHGFRVVVGSEVDCASRCDGHFYKTVESAVEAAKEHISMGMEANQPLLVEMVVKGFKFNDA
jgi:hypothetical protein